MFVSVIASGAVGAKVMPALEDLLGGREVRTVGAGKTRIMGTAINLLLAAQPWKTKNKNHEVITIETVPRITGDQIDIVYER